MPQKPLDQTLPIDGFKGGVGPAKGAVRPDTSHQEVPAELIWRLYNARKPFSQLYRHTFIAFSALTLLGGRKGIRPVKTERWGAGMVI